MKFLILSELFLIASLLFNMYHHHKTLKRYLACVDDYAKLSGKYRAALERESKLGDIIKEALPLTVAAHSGIYEKLLADYKEVYRDL